MCGVPESAKGSEEASCIRPRELMGPVEPGIFLLSGCLSYYVSF